MSDTVNNMDKVRKEFEKSDYYQKYENTTYVDSLLRNFFNDTQTKIKKDRFKGFEDAYRKNVEVMSDFFKLYYDKSKYCTEENGKHMLEIIYIDTDKKSVKKINDIECYGDAIVSLKRLFEQSPFDSQLVEVYKVVRKKEIFNFPSEIGGINGTRNSVFGDRIDCTLFDMKCYCETKKGRMIKAYKRKMTNKWFDECFSFSFEKIVKWFGIEGIFVNDNYDVYDLEKGNKETLKKLEVDYSWKWSNDYFKNVVSKIKCFNKK